MTNDTLADALDQFADLMTLENADEAQLEAYRGAAVILRNCVRPAVELVEEDGVEGLHKLGLGYLMSGMLTDWIRFGQNHLIEQIKARHARALTEFPGIGPGLAKTLQAEGIASLPELEEAAQHGNLADICGFGPKRIELVLAALATLMHRHARRQASRPVQLTLRIDQRAA